MQFAERSVYFDKDPGSVPKHKKPSAQIQQYLDEISKYHCPDKLLAPGEKQPYEALQSAIDRGVKGKSLLNLARFHLTMAKANGQIYNHWKGPGPDIMNMTIDL